MRDLPTPTQPLIDALPSLSLGASNARRVFIAHRMLRRVTSLFWPFRGPATRMR